MIDIHSHILPAIDDGASDVTEALDMACMAVDDGVTHMVATPHHLDFQSLRQRDIQYEVDQLQARIDEAQIPLTILPGHEIHLYKDVLQDWELGLASPLANSRYVLTEPKFHYYGDDTTALLFEFFEQGYIPIIAHPERIGPIQQDLSLIEPVLKRGALAQLTVSSLLLSAHSPARIIAETMLRQGMAHIIASDAHNTTYRLPGLTAGRDAAAEIIGAEQATALVTTNPQAVIDNEILTFV